MRRGKMSFSVPTSGSELLPVFFAMPAQDKLQVDRFAPRREVRGTRAGNFAFCAGAYQDFGFDAVCDTFEYIELCTAVRLRFARCRCVVPDLSPDHHPFGRPTVRPAHLHFNLVDGRWRG